jgi:4-diphosphocytidyl-2-C-methyl-D-erythritol kinase
MSRTRRARLRALAKLNLDLRVIARRPDHYHELRSIFHTISLADTINVAFTPGRRTEISLDGNIEIPNNLIVRAARAVLEECRAAGRVEFALRKIIPMGAGLGGGSSDAAAVLLALPVLIGRRVALDRLIALGSELGSDVPFFLLGGAAAGIGRGTELYPLPDGPVRYGVLAAPEVHVSTAEAYRALSPQLTSESQQNKIVSFQAQVWSVFGVPGARSGWVDSRNDFETVVLQQFPQLASLKKRLSRLGANPAMMTGSGSAIFGLFRDREKACRALESVKDVRVFPISLVSRARYRSLWWRALAPHQDNHVWPPLSRYAR